MSASLSSNGDNFIFNLPSDFIPKVLEDRYKIHLNNFRKPYATVIDYINSCIKDINLPGMNAPTVEQKEFYGKARNFRGSASPYDIYTRDFNITFTSVDFHVNYFIISDAFQYHYQKAGKPFVEPFTITVLDFERREHFKIYVKEILIKSLSDIRMANNDKGVDEKDFTLSLSFNYIDMEYMPRYGEGTTDGTKIEDYSNQLKKNDNT